MGDGTNLFYSDSLHSATAEVQKNDVKITWSPFERKHIKYKTAFVRKILSKTRTMKWQIEPDRYYFQRKLQKFDKLSLKHLNLHGRLDIFICKQQSWKRSGLTQLNWHGRTITSSFTLEVSVKFILGYNRLHARENSFYIKLQACAKLRIRQPQWHERNHT